MTDARFCYVPSRCIETGGGSGEWDITREQGMWMLEPV